MANPAEESAYSLSEETWHRIQARRRKADWRRQRAIARLVKPDADKLAAINTRCVLERLAAYAIPALEEILYPPHLASFLQSLDAERRFLLDVAMPIMSEHIRSVFGLEPGADFAFRCELLVNANFDGWESAGHRRVAEQLRHSQVQIAGIMRLGISRLTLDTESEKCECPTVKDAGVDSVPDSAIEGNNQVDPEAKAIENENSRHSHKGRQRGLEPDQYRPERMPVSLGSFDAVRKMDEHIREKQITLSKFAGLIPTSETTLRKFRRTGKVRRDIFVRIAALMGITSGALEEED